MLAVPIKNTQREAALGGEICFELCHMLNYIDDEELPTHLNLSGLVRGIGTALESLVGTGSDETDRS
jgi:hypothetical protein